MIILSPRNKGRLVSNCVYTMRYNQINITLFMHSSSPSSTSFLLVPFVFFWLFYRLLPPPRLRAPCAPGAIRSFHRVYEHALIRRRRRCLIRECLLRVGVFLSRAYDSADRFGFLCRYFSLSPLAVPRCKDCYSLVDASNPLTVGGSAGNLDIDREMFMYADKRRFFRAVLFINIKYCGMR